MLLRPDLMVGVTGDNPHEVIDDLIGHRDAPVDDVPGTRGRKRFTPCSSSPRSGQRGFGT